MPAPKRTRPLTYRSIGLQLFADQLVESAIPPHAARANRLKVTREGLRFPYYDIFGNPTGFHRTRLAVTTKAKYKQPPGTGCQLFIPLNNDNNDKMQLRETRLVVVEGEKKAISVAEALPEGWASMALGGVNSFWSGRRADREGERPIYTVFEAAGIPWLHERPIYVCFDSDVSTNVRVREAEDVLIETLRGRGCEVYSVSVPVGDDGRRQGADDWIAAKGSGEFLDELFLCQPKITSGVVRPLNEPDVVDFESQPQPPSYLVYPAIQNGANLWFGLPETLKSLTRNQALIDVLTNKPRMFGGNCEWEIRADHVDKVMMIASEEPMEEFASGLWRCAMGNGIRERDIPDLLRRVVFYSAPEYDLRLDRIADAWDIAGRPSLIFADHLLGLTPRRDIRGQDVNAVADPMVVIDYYLRLRMLFVREHVAFVCNAHTSKMNEGVYGSVAWAASSDTLTKFHRKQDDEDDPNVARLVIEPFKRRHSAREHVFELLAKFDAASGASYRIQYGGEAEVTKPGDSAKSKGEDTLWEVVQFVFKNPGCAFRDLTQGVDLGERQLRTQIGKAEHQHLVFSTTEGKAKRYYSGSPPV